MLERYHKILLGAFALQLVLLVFVLTRRDDSGAAKEHALLPGFDAAKVTKLEISTAPDKPAIELTKGATGWVVSSGYDFPVDESHITDLLAPLAKLSASAPIATQASRHKQLRVADDDYERKLTITADGKVATLFIGSSAGTRRTAVRFAGDDDVYAVGGLTPHLAGGAASDWIQTSYVGVPREDIAKLTIEHGATTVELSRADVTAPWTVMVDGAADTDALDTVAIERIAEDAASINASAPGDPKRDVAAPVATITIEQRPPKDDKGVVKGATPAPPAPIVVDVLADPGGYWVKQRGLARAALVDKAHLEPVVTVDKSKLLKPAPPPPMPQLPPGLKLPPGTELPPGMTMPTP